MLTIAHRGAMAERTENTLDSFVAAIDDGFNALEIDVQVCASDELVVFHDETLERLAGDSRRISDLTLDDITKVSIEGQSIPTLASVLDMIVGSTIFIELKDEASAKKTAEMVKNHDKNELVIISKNIDWLRAARRANTEVALGIVSAKNFLPPLKELEELSARYFVCHQWIVNWFGVRRAKQHDIKTIAYPVNSRIMARILAGHNIEGMMFDRKIEL